MKRIALVLSGGGSKGSYEVGVAKALKKLHINYTIITGTSVGALNGLILVQKELKKLIKIWNNIDFNFISNQKFPDKYSTIPELAQIYKEYAKAFAKDGGLDVNRLSDLCTKMFSVKKFYKSNIDYGLITYNLTRHKPIIKTKNNLKPHEVVDFVIASGSCYPAFKPKEINGEMYIDGGYYDNCPINLAISMGADEIIAVDLKAIGRKRNFKQNKIKITTIAPRNKIASFLVFDKTISKRTLKLGYNDTMKTFKNLDGINYTFKKRELVKNYNKYIIKMQECLKDTLKNYNNTLVKTIITNIIINNFHNKKVKPKEFNMIVEYVGKSFNLKEEIIYSSRYYNYLLKKELEKITALDDNSINLLLKTKKLNVANKVIIKYFYDFLQLSTVNNTTFKLILLFPKEFLSALYLKAIML